MTTQLHSTNPERFAEAIRRFDEENGRDPNRISTDGISCARELVYAQWLTDWVLKLSPSASEELRLAARSQHICRWTVPRESYPMTRAGYLQWREGLKIFHAKKAGEILADVGYPPETIARVQNLNLKKEFPHDSETRVLEDALCLVFLERQLGDLASKTSEDKVVNALQKSWKKMTALAREHALKLPYSPVESALLDKALTQAG
jgi:hypothetical protein